jgi:hypothetical protein
MNPAENTRLSPAPGEEATVEIPLIGLETQRAQRLLLRIGNKEWDLSPKAVSLLIGRDPSCALVGGGSCTSRVHARITRTDSGLWYLEDLGQNGTVVVTNGTGATILRRGQSMPLTGTGYIGLGAVPHPTADWTVRFRIA